MILISVDLPAPLSPSRPSTSPFFRCRFTSRSAVTGPKRLAMCSTRRTSSGEFAGETTPGDCPAWAESGVPAGSATARTPPARTTHVHVGGHRDEDRQSCVEEEVVRVYALQDQSILQHSEEQRPNQRAHHRARATGQEG